MLMAAVFLGPVGLNAAEVSTWSHASSDSGYEHRLASLCATEAAFGTGVAAQEGGWWCVAAAFVALGATAGCIAAITALFGSGPAGWLVILKLVGACALDLPRFHGRLVFGVDGV